MITESLSLALCTVVFRRFVDSVTGRIPALPVSSSPNTTALFMFTGALYYLYSHLRKGTLVRIGQGHPKPSSPNPSRHLIQRRPKNKSWFLRNAWGRRKNCTDAIYKIAKQSFESLHNLNPCLLLPNKSFQISFPKATDSRSRTPSEDVSRDRLNSKSCDIIYSNMAFVKEPKQGSKSINDLMSAIEDDDEFETKPTRRSSVKRLMKEKIGDNKQIRHCNKFSLEKRRTRSGKVYNPFS